jgi:hypothetical protein
MNVTVWGSNLCSISVFLTWSPEWYLVRSTMHNLIIRQQHTVYRFIFFFASDVCRQVNYSLHCFTILFQLRLQFSWTGFIWLRTEITGGLMQVHWRNWRTNPSAWLPNPPSPPLNNSPSHSVYVHSKISTSTIQNISIRKFHSNIARKKQRLTSKYYGTKNVPNRLKGKVCIN